MPRGEGVEEKWQLEETDFLSPSTDILNVYDYIKQGSTSFNEGSFSPPASLLTNE
jgi:hypothetical protein